jgi:hypothetical protein
MSFPWATLSGWEARTIDTPRGRPFVIVEVDLPGRHVRVRNFQRSQVWLYERNLEVVYQHACAHGPVRAVEVSKILENPNYREATYTAALVNALLGQAI